jgi:hypothetical protein
MNNWINELMIPVVILFLVLLCHIELKTGGALLALCVAFHLAVL